MKYLVFAFVAVLLAPIQGRAATRAQEMRFDQWLDVLEKPLSSTDKKREAVEALLKEPSTRAATFNLQALGRVYSDQGKGFEKLRAEVKKLEDALGEVYKWKGLNDPDKLDKAKDQLAEVLKDGKWYGDGKSPRIKKFRKFLKKFDFPSEKKDLKYIVSRLAHQLKKIDETSYDVSILEHGNGLHELRRELRWFLIEANVVDGPVTLRPARSCPIDAYKPLLDEAEEKNYGMLTPNRQLEVSPCRISKCLYLGVNKLVNKFGDYKDEAEQLLGDSSSDKVPEQLRVKAEKKYSEMVENGLLPALIEELKACED